MNTGIKISYTLTVSLMLVGALLSTAHAQHVQLLTQSPTQQSGILLDGTDTLRPGYFELAVGLNYARRPVIENVATQDTPLSVSYTHLTLPTKA